MKQKKLYLSASVCALCLTVAGAVVASRVRSTRLTRVASAAVSSQEAKAPAHMPYPYRVLPSVIRPQLRVPLGALGDRLTRPGKEHMALTGTLTRAGLTQAAQIISEFPNLLSVTGHTGGLASFDEQKAATALQSADSTDDALVETFFYDTAEHFFLAQARGAATRFLGARVSLEEASSNSSAPVYDVYEVTEEIAPGGPSQSRTKRYFFNSDSQLLEVVRYEIERDGSSISVEIRIGGWRKVQGQQVPASIVRLENGQPALSFVASLTTLAPRGGATKEMPPRKPV